MVMYKRVLMERKREDWKLRRKPAGFTTVTNRVLRDLAPANFSGLIFATHLLNT